MLSVVFSWPGLLDAGEVDHFAFSSITSPQRVGAPFAVTVSALDTNGVGMTNFSGPVQLFFNDQATPVYFNDFSGGFLFDTDGDGTSDGASLRSVTSSVTDSTYSFALTSNTIYSLSMDCAVNPGGASGVQFAPDVSPTVVDDTETDGPQPVTISASAPGFTSGSVSLTVSDNDVHHFSIGSGRNEVITSKTSTVPFLILVTAKDIASNTIASFTQAVTLTATGDLGFVALTPTNTGALNGGQMGGGSWFGSVVITNGANLNVRIIATDAAGHSGQSNPFTVYASSAQTTRIIGVQIVGNDVRIQFMTVAGRHYRLETAAALVGDSWSVAVPDIVGSGEVMTVTTMGGFAALKRFYRMALQAGP